MKKKNINIGKIIGVISIILLFLAGSAVYNLLSGFNFDSSFSDDNYTQLMLVPLELSISIFSIIGILFSEALSIGCLLFNLVSKNKDKVGFILSIIGTSGIFILIVTLFIWLHF